MEKHTLSATERESCGTQETDYVAEVAALWQELATGGGAPQETELAAALARRLHLPQAVARGVLQGFQTLVRYAVSECAAGSPALEARLCTKSVGITDGLSQSNQVRRWN